MSDILINVEDFLALPQELRIARLNDLKEEDFIQLLYNWDFWARKNQRIPAYNANPRTKDGTWQVWFPKCGRGWGKTRVGAETIRKWVKDFRYVNLAGATASDARDIMVEGESGILSICPKDERPIYKKAESKLLWPNGALSLIFTADEPERARGKQAMKLWCLLAGTRVTMGDGTEKEIQTIVPGESVLTRKGSKKVLGVSERIDKYGSVMFTCGIMVRGTANHPLIDTTGTTVCLSELSIGHEIPTVTSVPISGRPISTENTHGSTSIDGCGKRNMGRCRLVRSFITRMANVTTTVCRTLSSWIARHTPSCITKVINTILERSTKSKKLPAVSVESRCSAPTTDQISIVRGARTNELSPQDYVTTPVQFVGRLQKLVDLPTVVSVVRTWQEEGVGQVYDLLIEGEHEFFANGLLSHNCDEIASWRYRDAWDQLMFGLRLGINPQAIVTSTPKPTDLVKEIIADPNTLVTHGSTYDNRQNLANQFFSRIIKRYEGTRLGKQELLGQVLDDNPNAIFHQELIDRDRIPPHLVPRDLVRVGVGVDPAATSNEDSDETGIIIGARDNQAEPHFYIFEDITAVQATPNEWGMKVVDGYKRRRADIIVGETNNGGEMVGHVVRTINPNVNFKSVRATRGKAKRAEPIGALYEQGRVHHVGYFDRLESQQTAFDPSVEDATGTDRMDALVWLLTELSDMETDSPDPVTVPRRR